MFSAEVCNSEFYVREKRHAIRKPPTCAAGESSEVAPSRQETWTCAKMQCSVHRSIFNRCSRYPNRSPALHHSAGDDIAIDLAAAGTAPRKRFRGLSHEPGAQSRTDASSDRRLPGALLLAVQARESLEMEKGPDVRQRQQRQRELEPRRRRVGAGHREPRIRGAELLA